MQATPYLHFNGSCRQAFTHYQQLLGGELMLLSYKDAPPDALAGIPNDIGDKVMHVSLELDHSPLVMGSDTQGTATASTSSVALGLGDNEGARRVFDGLAQGGQVQMPLAETFWSECFGVVTDRYGVRWLIGGKDKPPPQD